MKPQPPCRDYTARIQLLLWNIAEIVSLHAFNIRLLNLIFEALSFSQTQEENEYKICLGARDTFLVIGSFESARYLIGCWSLCYIHVIVRLFHRTQNKAICDDQAWFANVNSKCFTWFLIHHKQQLSIVILLLGSAWRSHFAVRLGLLTVIFFYWRLIAKVPVQLVQVSVMPQEKTIVFMFISYSMFYN